MKVNVLTNVDLPGGLELIAETPLEALFLRSFANEVEREILVSCGGSILDDRAYLRIVHKSKDGTPLCSCPPAAPGMVQAIYKDCPIHGLKDEESE